MNTARTPWQGRTASLLHPPIAAVNGLAAKLAAEGRDLINLGQAVLGLAPPVYAMDAIREYMAQPGPHLYSPDPGLPELRQAISTLLRERKAVPCPSGQHVMVTCGANQAFANSLLAISNPGDEVVTFGPGYFDHDYTIAIAGCKQVEARIPVQGNRFVFDAAEVEKVLTPKTRCVVLVSPGNPTGAVAQEPFLRDLCDLCRARGIWILSDETYDLLTFPPIRHVSPASLDTYDRVVVMGSFSKIFGLAGWRVGYLAGSAELIDEAFKVQDALVICAPVASQRAVIGALAHLDEYVDQAKAILLERRDALLQVMEAWGGMVRCTVADGATFSLCELPGAVDDVAYCVDLVRDTGVVAVPGSAFGSYGRGWIRLSFGNQDKSRILEAGERLRAWKRTG